MENKVLAAVELIKKFTTKPIVMSSFGKDSIVLLDLVKKAGFKFPILFFKEPFFPKKYQFANEVILANEYVVYDYPPIDTTVTKNGKHFEIVNNHQVGNRTIYLPTGIVPGTDLCGLEDIFLKPTGTFDFPWIEILIGHKSSDVDPILGKVPLKADYFTEDDKTYIYPLRYFTDEDIWSYTIKEKLPINTKRYNEADNWKEFSDYTYNPDYFLACTACMDRDNPDSVYCYKVNKKIKNISSELTYVKANLTHYVIEGVS